MDDLQDRVIAETLERVGPLDFRDVVRLSYARAAVLAAAATASVVGVLALCAPVEAGVAFRRLFVPYSAPAWPRSTNLRLLTVNFQPIDPATQAPFKVIRGRKLELLVEDRRGRLPDDVFLEYSLPEEPALRDSLRHASLRDGTGMIHDVCLLSLPAQRGPVRFRALGGDDETMPDLEMQVVLPPIVEQLKLSLTPPRYAARSASELPTGEGRVRGIVGTQVSFEARSSKPLVSAAVAVNGKTAGTTRLTDPRTFRGTFVLTEPGAYAYSFQLKDVEGVENVDPPRYEIEALADLVPDVTIDRPSADATVTTDAQVPIEVSAKDDLGLRALRLSFHVGDVADDRAKTVSLATDLPRPEHWHTSIVWPLSSLSVSEGMRIAVHAEAGDWFDLGPAHVGKSAPRLLTVVSAKQKESEIVSRQADLLRIFERADQSQSQTREQTGDLDVQLDKAGRLRPSDVDVLKRAQADQRRVNQVLAGPADGAQTVVRGLLDELRQNRISSPETRQRLERFDRELAELTQSHLAAVDDHLTRAVKTSELQERSSDAKTRAEQSKSLKAARREQGIVLESLRTMLGDLAQWRDWQGVQQGLRELVDAQDKLNGDTVDLSRSTLAKPLSELGRQEQADLARLAERQSQLAEQVERLEQRLREAADGLKDSNREAAQEAAATLQSLKRSDPTSRMREIGGQLAQNNIGRAMPRQRQLLEELKKLDRSVSELPANDMQSFVARLGEAAQKVDALRNEQETLRKRTKELAARKNVKPNDPQLETLRKQQQSLKEEAEEAARTLRRLGGEDAAESLRQAASHMAGAEDELGRGPSASADAEQKEAVEELKRAQTSLNRSKKRAAQQLAQEARVRLAGQLKGLAARQKNVLDETKRLDAERAQAGRWTRGQLRSLQTVGKVEQQLGDETTGVAQGLQQADVFAWALRRGAISMQEAGQRISTQNTDARTVALELEAWTRLRDLAEMLKPDAPSPPSDQQQDEESSPPASSPGDGDAIPLIAQLKMLKTLQADLLRRTGEQDRQRRDATESSETSRGESNRLATEQGEHATLMQKIVAEAAGSGNKKPLHPPQEKGDGKK